LAAGGEVAVRQSTAAKNNVKTADPAGGSVNPNTIGKFKVRPMFIGIHLSGK
jgi:hypothetical protein